MIRREKMRKKSFRFVSGCLLICMFLALSLFLAPPIPARAGIVSDTVRTINLTRNPVTENSSLTQSYIFIGVDSAVGTDFLFAGGYGKLFLSDGQLSIRSTNFLVRSRHHFAAEGFHVVVMDAASDFLQLPGGLRGQRTGMAHLSDIAAVINVLPVKDPGPICLVGTSRGTLSAGAYAAKSSSDSSLPAIDCLVLTSSVTRPGGNPSNQNLLDDVMLESVNVSSHVVAHKNDGCFVTPPSDVTILESRLSIGSPKVKVKTFTGGTTTLSDECNALSAHGFFGIEPRVVRDIGKWIRKQILK
jgi:hypothetical protein